MFVSNPIRIGQEILPEFGKGLRRDGAGLIGICRHWSVPHSARWVGTDSAGDESEAHPARKAFREATKSRRCLPCNLAGPCRESGYSPQTTEERPFIQSH